MPQKHLLIINFKKNFMRKEKKNILPVFSISYKNGVNTFLKLFITTVLI